jgi:hypothetical protein
MAETSPKQNPNDLTQCERPPVLCQQRAFRSLYGNVPVQVRRLLVCPCQGQSELKSFAVLDLGHDAVAPELAYVTARYAALVPFAKVAVLLSG